MLQVLASKHTPEFHILAETSLLVKTQRQNALWDQSQATLSSLWDSNSPHTIKVLGEQAGARDLQSPRSQTRITCSSL